MNGKHNSLELHDVVMLIFSIGLHAYGDDSQSDSEEKVASSSKTSVGIYLNNVRDSSPQPRAIVSLFVGCRSS